VPRIEKIEKRIAELEAQLAEVYDGLHNAEIKLAQTKQQLIDEISKTI
jgi:hypothetical protein